MGGEFKTHGHIEINDMHEYFSNHEVRCLTEEEALTCEGELTIDECENVVKQLKNNKAPGSDGLTAEFYKAFWYDVKDLLITSINEGFVKQEESLKKTIIAQKR